MPKLYQNQQEEQYYIAVEELEGGSIRGKIVDVRGEDISSGAIFTIDGEGKLQIHGFIDVEAARKAGIQAKNGIIKYVEN